MDRKPEEVAEINRHKYFLSEKHGRDVGWEFAEHDWEQNHAAEWRSSQAELAESDLAQAECRLASEPDLVSQGCSNEATATAVAPALASTAPNGTVRVDSATTKKQGGLLGLFARVFSNSSQS